MKQIIMYMNEMTRETFDTPIEAITSEREYLDRYHNEDGFVLDDVDMLPLQIEDIRNGGKNERNTC